MMLLLILSCILSSFSEVFSQELTGKEILVKADNVKNAARDMTFTMKMILIDKNNNKKVRTAVMIQKGDKKRMFKFLSPASVKGVGVLVLENDMIYFYLPAFHKIRRIASHVKNDTFMGTDFTFDDMGSMRYADDYNVTKQEENGEFYILELKPKKEKHKEYSKLKMWVKKKDFYSTKIEYYNKKGTLWKVMTHKEITRIGKYLVAKKMKMKDLNKKHSTKMIMSDIKFDQGLSDKKFSLRYLKRR